MLTTIVQLNEVILDVEKSYSYAGRIVLEVFRVFEVFVEILNC